MTELFNTPQDEQNGSATEPVPTEPVAEPVGFVAPEATAEPDPVAEAAPETADEPDAPIGEAPEEEPPVPEKSFEEMTFEEALEHSLNSLNTDQRVVGIVMAVTPTEVQVDIGRKHAGYIPAIELSNDPAAKPSDLCQVGDSINLIVMKTNDQEGTVMLSKKRYDAIGNWDKVVAASESGDTMEGIVTEVIKGGLVVLVGGVRVFVPASQSGVRREDPLEELLRQTVPLKIIEIGNRRRAVGSIRQATRDQRRAQESVFWDSVEVGKTYNGVVKSLTSYGAFVDLGGIDGMVHISELSWGRIKHPSEVVNPGDAVEVYVKDMDAERRRISLGYKKTEDNPWEMLKREYAVDMILPTKIVSMTAYGAFANVMPGIDGLIHISQICDQHIAKAQDVLTVGQMVQARIVMLDFERKRVSLSLLDVPGNEELEARLAGFAAEKVEEAAPAEEIASAEEAAPVEEVAPIEE